VKILWHSAAPWEPTGYGTQTALWTQYLARQGHDMFISARTSLMYQIASHGDIPVLPGPPFMGDGVPDEMLPFHALAVKPDLIIVLYDMWHFGLPPERLPGVPVAAWMPLDHSRPHNKEYAHLASGKIYPVAMSHFGEQVIAGAGFSCGYVPHAIDTSKWTPLTSARAEIREGFRIPGDAFVVGINATSTDPTRKGLYEQIEAFTRLWRNHKNVILMMHTLPGFVHGMNVLAAMDVCGLPEDVVRFPPVYDYLRGGIPGDNMVSWYNALDVLANATYGEGFGLAAVEAQACGTPVILSDGSTGPQLVGPGWLVQTQPYWNAQHSALWHVPIIDDIHRALEEAYEDAGGRRKAAWQFAGDYDVAVVGPTWKPVLEAATGAA
jgi:glycosyltransferase involved in cell wall biosynthesis